MAAFQEMSTEYAVRARTGGNVRNRVRPCFWTTFGSACFRVTRADGILGYISEEIRRNTSNP